jgi:hypothetical protein
VSRVHEKFGEPLEDLLDLEGIRLLEICCGKWDANIADTSCDFFIGLYVLLVFAHNEGVYIGFVYQAHESIALLFLFPALIPLLCIWRRHAHPWIIRHRESKIETLERLCWIRIEYLRRSQSSR